MTTKHCEKCGHLFVEPYFDKHNCKMLRELAMPKKTTAQMITEECDSIKELLLKKNADYGDSALNPKRIFSQVDAKEQLKVRIDDKLSRLMNSDEKTISEDTVQDLIGYLILLRIAEKKSVDDKLPEA